MKRYFYLLGVLFLIGCSNQNKPVESTAVTEVQTEAVQSVLIAESVTDESPSKTIAIPDHDGLVDAIVGALVDLDATDASLDELIPDVTEKEINIDAVYALSDGKKIVVHCFYIDMTKHWIVNYIDSFDNPEIVYYVSSGEEYYDIYDLRTDKLLKESTRSFDESEFMSEAESRFDSISAEADKNLESIAEKYKAK